MTPDRTFRSSISVPLVTRIAVCTCALLLTACASRTYIPGSELPQLNDVDRSSQWPVVTTTNGESQEIRGVIKELTIVHARGSDDIGQPFDATVEGPILTVTDYRGPRTYSLAENPYVDIRYTDRRAGFILGGLALVGAGTPLVILGIKEIVDAQGMSDSGGLAPGLGKAVYTGLGVVGVVLGIGMVAPGIFLLTYNAKKPKPAYATTEPKLHVGPQGAGLSLKF